MKFKVGVENVERGRDRPFFEEKNESLKEIIEQIIAEGPTDPRRRTEVGSQKKSDV